MSSPRVLTALRGALPLAAPPVAAALVAALGWKTLDELKGGLETALLHRALPGPVGRIAAAAGDHAALGALALGVLPLVFWLALSRHASRAGRVSEAEARRSIGWIWLGSALAASIALIVWYIPTRASMAALGYAITWPALASWVQALRLRGASPLGIVARASIAFVAGLAFRVLPAGWPGESSMSWQSHLAGADPRVLLTGLIGVAAAAFLPLALARWASRAWSAFALALIPLLLIRSLAAFEPHGSEKYLASLASVRNTTFFQAAQRFDSARDVLERHVALLADIGQHVSTHPPGWTLAFRGAIALGGTRSGPVLAALSRTTLGAAREPSLDMASRVAGQPISSSEENGLWIIALILTLAAMATAPAVHFCLRAPLPPDPAFAGAALAALLGPLYLYFPDLDTLYPPLMLLAAGAWLRAGRSGRPGWALVSGLIGAALAALSFGNLALFLTLALVSALSGAVPGRGARLPRFAALALPLVVLVLAALPAGFSYVANLREGLRLHHEMMIHRTGSLWALLNPLDLMTTLPFPLALWLLLRTPWGPLSADARSRRLEPGAALGVAALATLAVLDVSGASKGETARLWMPFYALLLAGSPWAWTGLSRRSWVTLAALGSLVLVTLKAFYLFGWAFSDLFGLPIAG